MPSGARTAGSGVGRTYSLAGPASAFAAVMATVIVLLLIGVPPESLAIVALAMGGLFGAWLGTGHMQGREEER
ncbi:hypothetical protein GCM10010515_58210 [Streptomyces fructofermentans]|uniref:Uncharacterized protein n=1 Tax=Streptomyces fructofermentans TaxID=152141 RepID=A0A918NNB6_9ACTN|nr:hypothetical protein GCM10010515_58210 [Streptomyces fructofermentans]